MEREFNILAEKDKDEALQIIYQALEGLSREDTARLIYCAFEKFTRDVEEHDAQMSLWHGRKPN